MDRSVKHETKARHSRQMRSQQLPSMIEIKDIKENLSEINYTNDLEIDTEYSLECAVSCDDWLNNQTSFPKRVRKKALWAPNFNREHSASQTDIMKGKPLLKLQGLESYLEKIQLNPYSHTASEYKTGILCVKDRENETINHFINYYVYKMNDRGRNIYILNPRTAEIFTVRQFKTKKIPTYQDNAAIWPTPTSTPPLENNVVEAVILDNLPVDALIMPEDSIPNVPFIKQTVIEETIIEKTTIKKTIIVENPNYQEVSHPRKRSQDSSTHPKIPDSKRTRGTKKKSEKR